ncbi:MAG TPA: diguanylate cyclase [Gammaproteobacteria bacterium]|nr:diguanylate cyclase [Gammaproteobacteria bacterium]
MDIDQGKMNKNQHTSLLAQPIRRVLLVGFILVAVVPVSFLGFKLYNVAWEEAWREIVEKHQLLAQNLAEPIAIYIRDQRAALGLLSDFIAYQSGGLSIEVLDAKEKAMVRQSMKKLEGFRSISLVNTHGKMLVSTMGLLSEKQRGAYQQETCFVNTRANDRWYLSGVKRSLLDARPSIVLSFPVHGEHGQQTAILMGELRIELIDKIRKKIKFGKKGHSAIVDNKGRAIAHPNPDWMAEMRDLSSWPVVKKMIRGETGVTEFYSPFIKANMVAGFASVPEFNWGVMVPQPRSEIEAHVNRILYAQLTWGVIGFVMALVIAFLLVRWLTNPLQRLCHSASTIVDNGLQGEIPDISRHAPSEFSNLRARLASLVNGLQASRGELDDLNKSLQRRVDDATRELRGANRQLQTFASQDYLTKLYNRRYFESTLLQIIVSESSREKGFCLMMLDIDNFKPINDNYGHAAGDRVLIQTAKIIESQAGDNHLVARFAGDEFAILVEDNAEQARTLATSILHAVSEAVFEWQGELIQVTASAGVHYHSAGSDCNLDILLQNVDRALYTAKEEGRNRVSMLGI